MIKKKYSPDFIGIGAMRCGTTWIADKLRKHPEIYVPENFKELHFFDQFYNKGIEWYESNFSKKEEDQISGEFTPKYLRSPKIANLIKKHYPDTKLIISLRNPISRAFSHYNFLKKHTNIESNFYKSLFDKKYEILMAGLYSEQIQRYLNLFPRKNIHIILFDDIKKNPEDVVKNLYTFLEVDHHFRPEKLSKALNKRVGVNIRFIQIYIPKIKQFFRQYILLRTFLKYFGVFFVIRLFSKLNSREPIQIIDKKSENYLKNYYINDLRILENIVGREVSHWVE